MLDWIIKKEDFTHWFQTTKDLCGGTSLTTTNCNVDAVKDSDLCRSTLPILKAANSNISELYDRATRSANDGQNDLFFLEKLRSNPSLMRSTGSSFNLPDCKTSSSLNLPDCKTSSSLNLPDSKNTDMKTDHHSIGSNTLPDSDDGEDESEDGLKIKKYRNSTRFALCVVLALLLAIFTMGLSLAMMLNKRNKSNGGSSNTATISNTTQQQQSEEVNGGNSNTVTVSNTTQQQQSEVVNGGSSQQQSEEVLTKYDYTSNSDYLVGAYYYPWYGDNFHRGDEYLRKDLIPPQEPALGEYNDSDPQVIAQHMKWFRQANIGLLVTSWWGPNRIEDTNTKDVILEHEDIGNLKIALHYETTGRIKDTSDMSTPRNDIQYMCENYFDHPNYYKIDGRPVLFVYVTRVLHRDGMLEEALLTMRSQASKCGHNLYLVGDQVFQSAPDPDEEFVPFWYFDAVTNYDVYGSSGRPDGYAGKEGVDKYYSQQEMWKKQASKVNCRYIPPVSPGYNDRSVRLEKDNPPLSRRLTADSEEGSLFWYQIKHALQLVDPLVDNMILVNSFNEWHEDTQIEPAVSTIGSTADTTSHPELYTGGLEYVGYGELYLDMLGAATSKDDGNADLFDHIIQI